MCSNTCLSTLTGHYLNSFYPADTITLPYSLIEAAVGLANVAGAPLAAGLLLLDGTGGWAGWRWLFLIEGVPSVATGIAMLYVLPKDFAAATFLGAADKAWLAQVRWQQYDKFSWLFYGYNTADTTILHLKSCRGWLQGLMCCTKGTGEACHGATYCVCRRLRLWQ